MAEAGRRIDAHTKLRKNRERQLRRAAQAILLAESDWYSPARVAALSEELGALVDAAAVQEGRLTQAHIQGLYNDGGYTPNAPRTPVSGALRMGVTSAEAYARVPAQYRIATASGAAHEEALAASMKRLSNMLATDLQMVHREATKRVSMVNSGNTIGYRRIIRPELSGGNVCGLCIVAADRVYSISDLMPLHSGCHCDTAPITRDFDPGISLNREDLDAFYEAAGDTTYASGLVRVKLKIQDHGEYGPTLGEEGQVPTSARQAFNRAKPQNRSYEARPDFDAMIASAEGTVARLEREVAEGLADGSTHAALEWQHNHLARLHQRKSAGH